MKRHLLRLLAICLMILLLGLVQLFPLFSAMASGSSIVTSVTVALSISDVSASNISYYNVTISWKTNGNATSQIFYDTTLHDNIADYAHYTDEDANLVSEHSLNLTGLSSSITYHYRVRSAIPETEFIAVSEDYSFTTLTPWGVGGGGAPPPPTPTPPAETTEIPSELTPPPPVETAETPSEPTLPPPAETAETPSEPTPIPAAETTDAPSTVSWVVLAEIIGALLIITIVPISVILVRRHRALKSLAKRQGNSPTTGQSVGKKER